MQCPTDGTVLVMSERSGIEIDYCPTCRGVWLDRGELDKIIDRSLTQPAPAAPAAPAPSYQDTRGYDDRRYDDRRYDDRRYDDRATTSATASPSARRAGSASSSTEPPAPLVEEGAQRPSRNQGAHDPTASRAGVSG
ncbi:zf-TFIIB domain-containing protein [Nocardioides guangzhouensis]|uniref:TFIIB-type zinc ribbon-containing protein n=1 Tax=Nocardioides guangzhouensis TaxID=2497878 RepID=UPI001C377D8B|nr:zf-TFIIB domain-containing protein [Nocardioides guangzhouensis]